MKIPFNKPFMTGKEAHYMYDAVRMGKISGNGVYTQKVQSYFEEKYKFGKCLLTTSCTDALEMAAILIDIKPGDEILMPSYTFVSTANAFILRGAKIIFVDSRADHPGIDENAIEELITPRTKAIVPVHYAGVACDMEKIMKIARKYELFVIEDAAQAIDSYYTDSKGCKSPLGSIGHFAAFSFHETKNIISGEGGMLVVNDSNFTSRAEIIWEKGTNRSSFFRGEVDKYGWVDIGSSFLPSDIIAAFLWAQLENLDQIQSKRLEIWTTYLQECEKIFRDTSWKMPQLPSYATNNAHMFYMVASEPVERHRLINSLKDASILSVFHYLSLHNSKFYKGQHDGRVLKNSDRYSSNLLRLPFYFELSTDLQYVIDSLANYTNK